MRKAVYGGNICVMQWLVENGYVVNVHLATHPAVETGRLDMVEFLIQYKVVEAGRALDLATGACNLEMSKHLHERYWQKIRSSRFYPVAKSFWGRERAPLWVSPTTMASAIQKGSFAFVQWLYETFGSEIDLFDATQLSQRERSTLSLDTAAGRGDLALVKYLHEISTETIATAGKRQAKRAKTMGKTRLMCTTAAMDNAAAGGHLSVVKWLHRNRTEGCTTAAMNRAAGNGNLALVKWLATPAAAMDGAARRGHLGVVKWLTGHTSEGCTSAAMDGAASGGYLEMVKWLHSYRWEGCTSKAMDGAASSGHLQVVEWLHTHTSAGCTTEAMDSAARKGHLDVVMWLHEHRTEGCTTAAMDEAAHKGKFDVVKWLHRHRSEGCTANAMDNAKTLEIVQFLQINRTEGCSPVALYGAIGDGDFDRLLYLYSQNRDCFSEDMFEQTRKWGIYADIHEITVDSPTDNISDWLNENYRCFDSDSLEDSDIESLLEDY